MNIGNKETGPVLLKNGEPPAVSLGIEQHRELLETLGDKDDLIPLELMKRGR